MNNYEHHPLFVWLRDCAVGEPPLVDESEWRREESRGFPIQDHELFDGYLMTSLMEFIDEAHTYESKETTRYKTSKETNFKQLLTCICDFYNRLEQTIASEMPDLELLARTNTHKESLGELEKVIILILGCAIQSEKKHVFVNRITQFGQNIQEELAEYIRTLTDSTSLSVVKTDRAESLCNLKNGMKSKDFNTVDNDQESEEVKSTSDTFVEKNKASSNHTQFTNNRSTSPDSDHRLLTLQLASLNHENRHLRTQSENKDEECRRLEMELEERGKRISVLENQRLRLLDKERHGKELEDDLQAARCRIEKLQPLVNVEKKYREAEDERQFYKSKYEVVREKNNALEVEIVELEKKMKTMQMENHNKGCVEDNLLRMRSSVKYLETDIAKKNSEIEALMDDKHKLVCDLKEREDRIAQLETCPTLTTPRLVGCLADQLEEVKQDEFETMKAEIRKLRAQTEGDLIEKSYHYTSQEVCELKTKLASEELKTAEHLLCIQKLQEDCEHMNLNVERAANKLEDATAQLDLVRQEKDEAVKSLHEARRKFSQFQAEFGKRLEEDSQIKMRSLCFEIEELKRNLATAQEKQTDTDHQMNKIREEHRNILFELDEAREENSQLEHCKSQVERGRKCAETERDALKEKTITMEDEIENLKLQLLGWQTSKRKLGDKDITIERLHNEKGDMENELRTIQHQFNVETKKTQRLREDLVTEKSKRADLVGRLRSMCKTLNLNGGVIDVECVDDEQLINNIDDIMMNALVTVKRESDSLRIQQNKQIAELSDLKRDIEKLRRSESESLNESDDRVRKLTKENIHMKEQIYMLQEKLREVTLELSGRSNEIELAKNSIKEMSRNTASLCTNNSEIAKLQVTIRNSQIQEDLIKQENSNLREELLKSQQQNSAQTKNLAELEAMHKTLLADHSRLQQLHNLLTRDYDEAKHDFAAVKRKLENILKQQPINSKVFELESKLQNEVLRAEQKSSLLAALEKEHALCRATVEKLRHEASDIADAQDSLKTELYQESENNKKQKDIIDDLNKRLLQEASEVFKLTNTSEALNQLNRTYNEENKNLSRQLEVLLTQNKELLQRALHDKDQYHLEMKDFQDQLSALRRHKEKLEDKIMDQYRTMENKKSSERKQPLVKRAAKALINRRRAQSNGGSTTEDSSAYSADERASPPLPGNGYIVSPGVSPFSSCRTTSDECPMHGSFFKKSSSMAKDGKPTCVGTSSRIKIPVAKMCVQGAYTNPSVQKMIDMSANTNYYNSPD